MKNTKVVVAMSGGVDSSVVACLLKRQGFEIIGVFLKLCDLPNFREAEKQARKIAKILKIDFYVFDLRKEFKNKIIDYFLKEYKKGRTPNPCVLCNKEIKIDELFKKLKQKKINFDFVATGHYAKIQNYKLLKAKDKDKDQSYFLWMLKQKELRKILFPLGDYTKAEVKTMAKKFNLPVSKFHDSQEVCFIQDKKINDFLSQHIKTQSGDIVDTKNEVIGEHQGLMFHTIGQRTGIGLSGGPYYVMDKNIKKNILTVTKNQKDLFKKELVVKNVNYIAGRPPKLPIKVSAKIRYHHEPANATLKYQKMRWAQNSFVTRFCYLERDEEGKQKYLNRSIATEKMFLRSLTKSQLKERNCSRKNFTTISNKLIFDKPQKAITPGQSVVFYNKQQLLGGGIIDN